MGTILGVAGELLGCESEKAQRRSELLAGRRPLFCGHRFESCARWGIDHKPVSICLNEIDSSTLYVTRTICHPISRYGLASRMA